jgi:hypothetical protein
MRNANTVLVETPGKKRLLGITRRRCEYNIKMGVKEIGWV